VYFCSQELSRGKRYARYGRRGARGVGGTVAVAAIGVDVCAVARMERELAREGGGFRDAVFTPAEIAWCEGGAAPARRFAVCFAAKEAVIKALRGAAPAAIAHLEIELRVGPRGVPRVTLHGGTARAAGLHGIAEVIVSLAHTRDTAIAWAIASGRVASSGEVR
jgi:holo-[acyl-carrier protein] synthase